MLKLFTEHPASVGETYLQHLGFAARTGGTLISAGLACIVHGVTPFLFTTTGSRAIRRLAASLGGAAPRQPATPCRAAPTPARCGISDLRAAELESLASASL
jgi:hypothetical protein